MNDDIKDLLDSAAPDHPDLTPGARSGAVRDRARAVRRRNGVALAAAAVVAVVGIGGAIAVVSSGDDDSGTIPVAADPTPTEVVPPACPAEPIDVSDAIAVDSLPDGAISARACPAVGGEPVSADLPADTLVTEPVTDRIDEFTSEVRGLAPYTSDPQCALISLAQMPWAIVVSYPDGTSATLGSTTTICSSISVEGTDRDVDAIRSIFNDAATPKADESPEGTDGFSTSVELECPTTPAEIDAIVTTPDTADLADFTPFAGIVCYVADPLGSPVYAEEQGPLSPGQVKVIGDDLAANTTSSATEVGRCRDTGPIRVVHLYDDAGTGVVRVDLDCTGEFTGGGLYWKAGDRAEAVMDQALGGRVPR